MLRVYVKMNVYVVSVLLCSIARRANNYALKIFGYLGSFLAI